MEVLKITTDDYTLNVASNGVEQSFARANKRNKNIETSSKYIFTGNKVNEFKLPELINYNLTSPLTSASFNTKSFPVFFENKDYLFDIEFNVPLSSEPFIYSPLKEIKLAFIPRNRSNKYFFTGAINYGNEIGKTSFVINYTKENKIYEDVFEYEVFPTKLDYKNDYNQIIKDINEDFSGLVLEYLQKTYSGFNKGDDVHNDIVWWNVFGGLYESILSSSRLILNKPHNRLINDSYYSKADRIKFLTPALEEEVAEHRRNPAKYYIVNKKTLTVDTTENRFFKFVIKQIYVKYKHLKNLLLENKVGYVTEEFKERLNIIENNFSKIVNNNFFRQIGEFRGLKQESLVLQKATGYSSLFRNWIILKKGIEFLEGVNKIELKSIEKLYQIWCFLKMKNMIKEILGKDPEQINLAEILIDNFTIQLRSGRKSKIAFRKENGELIELFHEMKYLRSGIDGSVSFTVNQEPDIVLKLTKDDLIDDSEFTYLYDAKYRLMSDEDKYYKRFDLNYEYPPDDAINQMHRYRDAIYYKQKDIRPKKEVIGAYILFPGDNEVSEIEKLYYNKSIKEVNIGAFPLLPQKETDNNSVLLSNHLKEILGYSSDDILVKEVISQKYMEYEEPDGAVIVSLVKRKEHIDYINDKPEYSYLYVRDSKDFENINKIRYYAPWIDKVGVTEYFECTDVSVKERKDIMTNYITKGNNSDLCYQFKIKNRIKLNNQIKPEHIERLFKITTLSKLRKAKSFSEL